MDNSGHVYDEDLDPTIASLRYVDYRYLRFFYHPIEDKFSLINGWKDHSWTDAKAMRGGLDADERDSREQIFGKNNINIQQKNVPQLLMDEVSIVQHTEILELPSNPLFRPFIPSICSRWLACSFGQWTNTITMLSAFSSFQSSVSQLLYWRQNR